MVNDLSYDLLRLFFKKSIPISLLIEVTKRCNWNCIFCYAECNENDGLEIDVLINVLESFKKLGTFNLTFTGGEPFLKQEIWEIIERAKHMGFALNINTNGSLLNAFDIEKIAKYFSKINVSLHAVLPETHNYIVRNNKAWENTTKNLYLLKKYHANVEINSLITHNAISQYWKLREFVVNELGFTWNPDIRITPTYSGNTDGQMECEVSEQEIKIIKNEAEICGNSVYKHQYFSTNDNVSNGICRAGATTCFMDADGYLYPCLSFKRKGKNMLNDVMWLESVKDKEVEDIWKNNYMFNSLRKLNQKDFSKCLRCGIYNSCFKCVAENYVETNTLVTPSEAHCKREWELQSQK